MERIKGCLGGQTGEWMEDVRKEEESRVTLA